MVAAGAEHTVAITEDGELYGWGWGRYGNLGLGDRNDRLVPEKVASVDVCNTIELITHLVTLFTCKFQLLFTIMGIVFPSLGTYWVKIHYL